MLSVALRLLVILAVVPLGAAMARAGSADGVRATVAQGGTVGTAADEPPQEQEKEEEAEDPQGPRRSVGSVVAALVPGALLHGAGHYVGGDGETAVRLLGLQGIGLGLLGAGAAALGLTGASRRLVGPLVAVTIGGTGLFMISGVSDLYGVLAPGGGWGQPLPVPRIEVSAGPGFVYNPTFDHGPFATLGTRLGWGLWVLTGALWAATNDDTQQLRVTGARRFWGARPGTRLVRDGSFLEVAVAYHLLRYGGEGFSMHTGEIMVQGRYDLARFARSLGGSFCEGTLGYGLGGYHYVGYATDPHESLVARFGWGLYLGGGADGEAPGRGEVTLYYDHRHDDLVGGMKLPGAFSGPFGHFGVSGTYFLFSSWGLRGLFEAGSAYLGGLQVVFRQGLNR